MKKWMTTAAVCMAAGLISAAGCVYGEVKVGDKAPLFTLKDSKGKYVYKLEKFVGKRVVFLNFFATWCQNCKEEMEELKRLDNEYRSKGLTVWSINVEEPNDKVNKFIEKFQLPFPVLMDTDSAVAQQYNLTGFPANIIIDGTGTIRYYDSPPPGDFKKLFDSLKTTIKKGPPKTQKPVLKK